MAAQELIDHDMSNCKSFSEQFLEILVDGELTSCLLMTKHTSISQAMS
jgi:hypothetical protein